MRGKVHFHGEFNLCGVWTVCGLGRMSHIWIDMTQETKTVTCKSCRKNKYFKECFKAQKKGSK